MTYQDALGFATQHAMLLSMIVPFAACLLCLVLRNLPNLRDGITFLASVATFVVVFVGVARFSEQRCSDRHIADDPTWN